MTNDDAHWRLVTTSGRISPDEITSRAFPTSFRGLAEGEVRSWLKRVAAEVSAMRDRERELAEQVADLERKVATPVEVTEERLLASLGEETARVLRAAQEAAEEIRSKAEERASRVVHDAQEEARRIREDAEGILTARTGEADATAAELLREAGEFAAGLRSDAETYASELRTRVEQDAAERAETARGAGREIVEEAQAVRERVLSDLATRRTLLQTQLEELRGGRDRLLDAYRTVKRTLDEATDALAQVESRASSELPSVPLPPLTDVAALLESFAEADDAVAALAEELAPESDEEPNAEVEGLSEDASSSEPESAEEDPVVDVSDSPAAEPSTDVTKLVGEPPESHESPESPESLESPESPEPEADSEDSAPHEVEALFARLRDEAVPEPPKEPTAVVAPVEEAEADPVGEADPGVAVEEERGAEMVDPAVEEGLLQRRDQVLDPLSAALLRKLKRSMQDEQNGALDALRRHRGALSSLDVESLFPSLGDQVKVCKGIVAPVLARSYEAGLEVSGSKKSSGASVLQEMAESLAQALVEPLRDRVVEGARAAVSLGEEQSGVSERINARYREWKTRLVEPAIRDALAAAYGRGLYEGFSPGAPLRWIVDDDAACPDCDDNALEVTERGSLFPTGQAFPPAHPGCRCMVALAEESMPTRIGV